MNRLHLLQTPHGTRYWRFADQNSDDSRGENHVESIELDEDLTPEEIGALWVKYGDKEACAFAAMCEDYKIIVKTILLSDARPSQTAGIMGTEATIFLTQDGFGFYLHGISDEMLGWEGEDETGFESIEAAEQAAREAYLKTSEEVE